MATMKDVALRAGVSLSTVSYALNENRPITDATRDRVMRAIADLGYTRNAAARTLAGSRSHVLALVLPPGDAGLGATLGSFVSGAADQAERYGYSLVVWPFAKEDSQKVGRLVRERLADGVLVMEVALQDARIDALERAGTPFTMIGRTRDLTGRSWVDIDFDATVVEAIDRLVALGHRSIALINHSAAKLESGYGAAVRTRDAFMMISLTMGLDVQHVPCEDTPLAGQAAVADVLAGDPSTTAFITMNEMATFGVITELARRGYRIPQDMSVFGIVTSPIISAISYPPLTCLQAPGVAIGATAVHELIEVLGKEPRRDRPRLLPCLFDEGGSLAIARHDSSNEEKKMAPGPER